MKVSWTTEAKELAKQPNVDYAAFSEKYPGYTHRQWGSLRGREKVCMDGRGQMRPIDMVETVTGAGGTVDLTLDAPPFMPAVIVRESQQEETAVLVCSDIHMGKETTTYNPAVFRRRMAYLNDKIGDIREIYKGFRFDKLKVLLLGDIVDGTEIYPGQVHEQAQSNVEAQAHEVAGILADTVKQQDKVWGQVEVEGVLGNHGRAGMKAHLAANWDLVSYRYLASRVKGVAPVYVGEQGRLFLRKIGIRGHHYLIYHGQAIRSFASIPWYGMQIRSLRWLSTDLAPFEVLIMGHFHSCGMWPINNIKLVLNGTMSSNDGWALETFGYDSQCKWWLFGVSNKKAITWSYDLDLTDGDPVRSPDAALEHVDLCVA